MATVTPIKKQDHVVVYFGAGPGNVEFMFVLLYASGNCKNISFHNAEASNVSSFSLPGSSYVALVSSGDVVLGALLRSTVECWFTVHQNSYLSKCNVLVYCNGSSSRKSRQILSWDLHRAGIPEIYTSQGYCFSAMDPPVARAGRSLAGTSIEQHKYTFDFKNVFLPYVRIYTSQGYCFHPPQPTIEKNTREVCCFSKTSGAARGAIGVLMYEILTDSNRTMGVLAIMFSVPFNYNLYRNWFALGIYDKRTLCNYDLFYEMYYASGPFTRSKARGTSIEYSGRGCVVKGAMSAFGQSIMKVEFRDY
ncbi:hypothetical protein NFI96_026587 [Prochilodus magdalenae]|nr:hypothetical protein NFI96_026587 [Prochilodus magdalenae]